MIEPLNPANHVPETMNKTPAIYNGEKTKQ